MLLWSHTGNTLKARFKYMRPRCNSSSVNCRHALSLMYLVTRPEGQLAKETPAAPTTPAFSAKGDEIPRIRHTLPQGPALSLEGAKAC